jgi:hypothetical protein
MTHELFLAIAYSACVLISDKFFAMIWLFPWVPVYGETVCLLHICHALVINAGLQIEGILAYFTHLKRIGDYVGDLKYVVCFFCENDLRI